MAIHRREFIKTTAAGSATLAMSPSFNHLLAAPAHAAPRGTDDPPHRFVFIRKSNGNDSEFFGRGGFANVSKRNQVTAGAELVYEF